MAQMALYSNIVWTSNEISPQKKTYNLFELSQVQFLEFAQKS